MTTKVQARLDAETQAVLDRLRQRGLSTSEVIRDGIHLVEKQQRPAARPRMIGIGMLSSGMGDLATNKKYMEGFGAKGLK
jgi:Arc/MetJ-type ribon-helix-helix transcriptional regulator